MGLDVINMSTIFIPKLPAVLRKSTKRTSSVLKFRYLCVRLLRLGNFSLFTDARRYRHHEHKPNSIYSASRKFKLNFIIKNTDDLSTVIGKKLVISGDRLSPIFYRKRGSYASRAFSKTKNKKVSSLNANKQIIKKISAKAVYENTLKIYKKLNVIRRSDEFYVRKLVNGSGYVWSYFTGDLHAQKYNILNASADTGGKMLPSAVINQYRAATHSALYSDFHNYIFKLTCKSLEADSFIFYNSAVSIPETSAAATAKKLNLKRSFKGGLDEFLKIYGRQPIDLAHKSWLSIRFKPGYPRFFRKLRRDFMNANYKKFPYQKRLTSFIWKFKNLSNAQLLNISTLSLGNVLINCKLCNTLSESSKWILGGFIFINGRRCISQSVVLQGLDRLQLCVNYVSYFTVASGYIARLKNLRIFYNFILRNYREVQSKITWEPNYNLKSTSRLMNKVRFFRLVNIYLYLNDVPGYMEVDYLSMSLVLLRSPSSEEVRNYIEIRRSAISYVKMLNWKYIN